MNKNIITVSEHRLLRLNDKVNGVKFDSHMLSALQKFYGEKGVPYYNLGHNSVKFCEYVGVIQIGQLTIEILPKPDPGSENDSWRTALIGMLRTVAAFPVEAPSSSQLKTRANSILDLYFELFIAELESLIRQGLVKKYRSLDGNCNALKGSLLIGKDIQQNLTRRDRFFTRHTTYDADHHIHQLLWATIRLIARINTQPALQSRIKTLALYFPEQQPLKVSAVAFLRLPQGRRTAKYETALAISKLLLLNYHPDIKQGNEDVLALMFDMNDLWEKFVLVTLKRKLNIPGVQFSVTDQVKKQFWKPQVGYSSTIRPDIYIRYHSGGQDRFAVLDTKWKNLNGLNPSADDLRQLYVYHAYYHAERVALVYPGKNNVSEGKYYDPHSGISDKSCAVISIQALANIKEWQTMITSQIQNWLLQQNA